MSDYQRIEVGEQDSITRVRFVDSKILDQALVKQLAEELQKLVANTSTPNLLLDLSAVTFLSSAALNNLVVLNKKVQKQNGKFVLVGVQPPVYEVLNITGLNRLFKVAESDEEALNEMASTG
jgi:anti-sigma B factor antagonist